MAIVPDQPGVVPIDEDLKVKGYLRLVLHHLLQLDDLEPVADLEGAAVGGDVGAAGVVAGGYKQPVRVAGAFCDEEEYCSAIRNKSNSFSIRLWNLGDLVFLLPPPFVED